MHLVSTCPKNNIQRLVTEHHLAVANVYKVVLDAFVEMMSPDVGISGKSANTYSGCVLDLMFTVRHPGLLKWSFQNLCHART